MESPDDLASLQGVMPALLLNRENGAFRTALQNLEPARVTDRVRRLKAEIEAGSAKAEFTIATDPLGLLGAALGPLNAGGDLEKGPSLTSADGRLQIVPVVTNQESLDQPACAALMEQVNRFKDRFARPGKEGRRLRKFSLRDEPLTWRKSRTACGATSNSRPLFPFSRSVGFSISDSAGCCRSWVSR
jgi:hypothetical protein